MLKHFIKHGCWIIFYIFILLVLLKRENIRFCLKNEIIGTWFIVDVNMFENSTVIVLEVRKGIT